MGNSFELNKKVKALEDELNSKQLEREREETIAKKDVESLRKDMENQKMSLEKKHEQMRKELSKSVEEAESLRQDLAHEKDIAELKLQEQRDEVARVSSKALEDQVKLICKMAEEKDKSHKEERETSEKLEKKNQQLLEAERKKNEEKEKLLREMAEVTLETANKNKDYIIAQNNEFWEMLERMHNVTTDNHTQQIETLSKGLESITDGLKSMGAAMAGSSNHTVTSIEGTDLKARNAATVIIVNFQNRDSLQEHFRDDEDTLRQTLEDISDVKPIAENKSLAQVVKEYSKENYTDYDCIIVAVISPGSNKVLEDERRNLPLRRITQAFQNNASLKNKPKIYLVQVVIGADEAASGGDATIGKEALLCYCEIPERHYVQNTSTEGSVFVQALCESFKIADEEMDFARILDNVQNKIDGDDVQDITFQITNNLSGKVYVEKS